ncbi:MAG: NAD-dependent epimerase/dehydratase family protein, partial [Desulfuromonadales bacterium]|nr:NAD-dependent epimerase/dehydratase family protein [Desulfuromonadales bacterium]
MQRQSDCLIIGYGDIAKRTARRLYHQGCAVTVVGRTVPLDETGLFFSHAIKADLDQPWSLEPLPTAGFRILYLAPPAPTGEVDSRVRNLCDRLSMRLPATPQGIVYVSTSGVYGDCAGEIVDEKRPVNPQTDRAQRRVDAENVLQKWGAAHLVPVVILRVAGIYGPGRLPLQRLQAGMPVLLPEQ